MHRGIELRLRRFGAGLCISATAAMMVSACGRDDNATRGSATTGPSPVRVACGGKPTLKAGGSTAQANAMTRFVKAFEETCPGQSLNYTANGSGAGIGEFIGNQTDFGGSDSPLSKDEYARAQPRCGSPVWNLPVVFGPIAIAYHVTGVTSLNLDGPTAARIFNGGIPTWNDPAIFEEQLRQNEKLSALGLLAAEVAHEIRNPLTVMKLLYHSLDLKFSAGDPRAKDARLIEAKIEHLNRIVEQILAFARTTEPQPVPVNLNELIDELGLLVRHKLANQNVEFVRDLQPDLPRVPGDAPQLEQAFLNLILNAAEAMPDGGRLTIRSRAIRLPRASTRPTHVALEFKDTGKGMSEELQRHAFTTFLSTTKAKGTGLGLAIVGRIIDTHRGNIRIKSRLNHGTIIAVSLPV